MGNYASQRTSCANLELESNSSEVKIVLDISQSLIHTITITNLIPNVISLITGKVAPEVDLFHLASVPPSRIFPGMPRKMTKATDSLPSMGPVTT